MNGSNLIPHEKALPDSLKEHIREMVTNGMSRSEVTRLLKPDFPELTYNKVWFACRDLGGFKMDITSIRAFYNGEPRRDVVMRQYDAGVRPVEIARQTGISHKTVLDDIYRTKQKRLVEQARVRHVQRLEGSPKLRQRQEGPVY